MYVVRRKGQRRCLIYVDFVALARLKISDGVDPITRVIDLPILVFDQDQVWRNGSQRYVDGQAFIPEVRDQIPALRKVDGLLTTRRRLDGIKRQDFLFTQRPVIDPHLINDPIKHGRII